MGTKLNVLCGLSSAHTTYLRLNSRSLLNEETSDSNFGTTMSFTRDDHSKLTGIKVGNKFGPMDRTGSRYQNDISTGKSEYVAFESSFNK